MRAVARGGRAPEGREDRDISSLQAEGLVGWDDIALTDDGLGVIEALDEWSGGDDAALDAAYAGKGRMAADGAGP